MIKNFFKLHVKKNRENKKQLNNRNWTPSDDIQSLTLYIQPLDQ